jgi:hypothetical protein
LNKRLGGIGGDVKLLGRSSCVRGEYDEPSKAEMTGNDSWLSVLNA